MLLLVRVQPVPPCRQRGKYSKSANQSKSWYLLTKIEVCSKHKSLYLNVDGEVNTRSRQIDKTSDWKATAFQVTAFTLVDESFRHRRVERLSTMSEERGILEFDVILHSNGLTLHVNLFFIHLYPTSVGVYSARR